MRKRKDTLGDVVKQARLKYDVTAEELADRIGVSVRYIYRIESGDKSQVIGVQVAMGFYRCLYTLMTQPLTSGMNHPIPHAKLIITSDFESSPGVLPSGLRDIRQC